MFVKAHEKFNKTDYDNIAAFIGTKTADEVKKYSTHFFEKAPNNERLAESLRSIQYYQARLKRKQKD